MSCSMQRQLTLAVSIFQTHSRGESGRQNEVDCTLQSGLSILHWAFDPQVRPPQCSGVVGGGSAPAPQFTSRRKRVASGRRVQKRSQVMVVGGVAICLG